MNKKIIIIGIITCLFISGISFSTIIAEPPNEPVKKPGMLTDDAPYYTYLNTDLNNSASLGYTPPPITGDLSEWINQINENVVLNYIQGLVNFGPRVTGSSACDDAGTYIHDEFVNMGLSTQYHFWTSGSYSGKNVEATLPGIDPSSDKIFIVLGHYDSVSGSPGADDNAAGTAAALAAAEILKQYEFNHTIRFLAVDGEEQGLHGSDEYAEDAANNGDNIIAALNADMIGFAPDPGDGDLLKLYTNTASEWLYDYVVNISAVYEPDIGYFNVQDSGYSSGSDHASFWSEGYDACFYHEHNFNDYYHSPEDQIQYMNMTYDAKVTKLIVATLAELAEPVIDNSITAYYPTYYSAGSLREGDTDSTTFEIWNAGDDTLTYEFVETCDWLDIYPLNGTSTGEHDTITIDINTSGLSIGNYQYDIGIKSSGGDGDFTVYVSVFDNVFFIDSDQIIHDRGYPIRHAADGDWGASQNFTPTLATLTSAELYLRKFGSPEFDLMIEIREDSVNGPLIDMLSFTPSEVDSNWQWFTLNFSDITVTVNMDYFITIPPAPTGVTTSFGYEWAYAFGDQYTPGSFWFTRDGGALWRDLPTRYDYTFRTFGL